jgi:hypothetical protein
MAQLAFLLLASLVLPTSNRMRRLREFLEVGGRG